MHSFISRVKIENSMMSGTIGYRDLGVSIYIPFVKLKAMPTLFQQICNGMIAATIVFFADLYFLVKHTS